MEGVPAVNRTLAKVRATKQTQMLPSLLVAAGIIGGLHIAKVTAPCKERRKYRPSPCAKDTAYFISTGQGVIVTGQVPLTMRAAWRSPRNFHTANHKAILSIRFPLRDWNEWKGVPCLIMTNHYSTLSD